MQWKSVLREQGLFFHSKHVLSTIKSIFLCCFDLCTLRLNRVAQAGRLQGGIDGIGLLMGT